MLVNIDAKSLEVHVGAWLSKDSVMYKELLEGLDMHSNNMQLFGLPSRLIAKIFMFRLMYGGTEYSYAQDPDFASVSSSPKYWKKVIDAFYSKYKGFADWHTKIVQEVTLTSKLRIPGTGREFSFKQYPNRIGGMDWPITQIKNYPVQGTGADLMAIARLQVAQDWKRAGLTGVRISSVHDSIVADVPDIEVKAACKLMLNSFEKVPRVFEKAYGIPYDLPFKGECSYGPNLCDMEDFKC
jgi:DNA polymerase-1